MCENSISLQVHRVIEVGKRQNLMAQTLTFDKIYNGLSVFPSSRKYFFILVENDKCHYLKCPGII